MKRHRIDPGSSWSLADHDPDDTGDFETDEDGKAAAKAKTEKLVSQMDRLQVRLFSNRTRALLIVLQGMDTSGKDSTIRHVMSGMNPQGCRVAAFKAPTTDERAHDFLWRIHREVPAKGYKIGRAHV